MTDGAARAAHAWIYAMLGNPFQTAKQHMHPDTATLIADTINTHRHAADGHPAPTAAGFVPQRGDMVEVWLRQHRDHHTGDTHRAFHAALTEYRAHADAAVPLVRTVHPKTTPCTWYLGDRLSDVPDDYNGSCLNCGNARDTH